MSRRLTGREYQVCGLRCKRCIMHSIPRSPLFAAVIELPRNLIFGPVDCGVAGTAATTGASPSAIDFVSLRGSGPLAHVAVEALAEQYERNKETRKRRLLKKSAAVIAGRTASFSEHPAKPPSSAAEAPGAAPIGEQPYAGLSETVPSVSPHDAVGPSAAETASADTGAGPVTSAAPADPAGGVGGFDIAELIYADFELASSGGMSLVTHDFSWEEHAYSLLQRYYPVGERAFQTRLQRLSSYTLPLALAAAPVLDTQFRITYAMTYHTFGGLAPPQPAPAISDAPLPSGDAAAATGAATAPAPPDKVNTENFRTAIWNYVQRLYGVRNDHYDYQKVNSHMTLMTKTFIKKVRAFCR